MEDGVVIRIKNGPLKFLFDEKSIITNYPGSGNNWAEGYCSHGPKYEEKILNVIQRSVEQCDSLHGFLVMLSTGGGTGSGVGSYVLKLLADNYPLIDRQVVPPNYSFVLVLKENNRLINFIINTINLTQYINTIIYNTQYLILKSLSSFLE